MVIDQNRKGGVLEAGWPLGEMLAVGGAAIVSVVLLYFATGSSAMALAYAGGLVVLGLGIFSISRRMVRSPSAGGATVPDWSVTAAAIEQSGALRDVAIVITDRASRMVCANTAYERAFGSAVTPSRLALSHGMDPAAEELSRAMRAAWRDGASEELTLNADETVWTVSVRRAGAGQDYLVWSFTPQLGANRLGPIIDSLTGPLGKWLSAAGIEAALVGADWTIEAASSGFAMRACGDAGATLAGHEFLSLLRSDERDRIYFAREGAEGSAQALISVPLTDQARGAGEGGNVSGAADGEELPALMLLMDSMTCLAGWSRDSEGQTEQLAALLARLPLGLAVANRDGHFLFANEAFYRAAHTEGEDLPPYPSDLVVRADKGIISDAVRRCARGVGSGGDISIRLEGDPDEPVSLGLARVRGLGEAAVLLSLADKTEEARLKQQIAQATKMQAVGQLAGGVAHDFNNVLTAIIGYCDLMLLRHLPGDSDYDDIQQIKANSNRAIALTRQLLAFSRQQTLQPQVIQVPDVLTEVSHLLRRLLGAKIQLEAYHDRDLAPVRADPSQIEQVIINLAVNARDAIQARHGDQAYGRLTFTTQHLSAADIRDPGSQVMPAGDYIALIAEDTGGGLPPDIVGKVFEPFFTTKELGKGTGLGLSTVYGIVKQSGGFIFASNVAHEDGAKGARFSVYLPVHHSTEEELGQAAHSESEARPLREWSGGGRILLVEDEDMVRAVAERALTREGYSVVTAADGDEGLDAMRASKQAGEAFDLIISDVVMPNMDGTTMVREIRKEAPDIPVLFMSGYAEGQLRGQINIDGVHFMAKPFSVAQIAAKVGEILQVECR